MGPAGRIGGPGYSGGVEADMKKAKAKPKKVYKTCAGCGTKVLKSQGMMSGGKFYCCEDCK